MAIVQAIASIEGVETTEVDCLYDAIDPEALDRLVEASAPKNSLVVEFRMSGYQVRVRGDRTVVVEEQTE
jgi:hypothetical protein